MRIAIARAHRRVCTPLRAAALALALALLCGAGAGLAADVPAANARGGASDTGVVPASAAAATPDAGAQSVLHLLDYVGVDYAGAVRDGKVLSEDEFKEMQEFSGRALDLMQSLPANPAREQLVAQAVAFRKMVQERAAPAAVAQASALLRGALVQAYKVPVAPRRVPDMARGAALYAQNCAACHGATGLGDGPAGKGLDPVPANFHDAERMQKRGLYGLYNTISLGVANTAMRPFTELGEDERWALAFHVATLSVPAERVRAGEALWKAGGENAGTTLRRAFPDLASVVTQSPDELRARLGEDGVAVQAYLGAHPEALQAGRPAPIAYARQRMAESVAAYERGDRAGAQQLAVGAYLEGFEIVESPLDNVDAGLRAEIEREMLEFRNALQAGGDAATVRAAAKHIDDLLSAADDRLAGGGLSPTGAFFSSLIILLREGLEAILVLSAIVAFVVKTGRRDALPWVHAGWIGALALGALTWVAATYFISISGANRELTEGITALVASAMLLYVGYWLHGKSKAQAWTQFLRAQVSSALEQRTLRTMAAISFIAVYREIFEVVLFYEALWAQAGDSGHGAVAGGIAAAAVLLAIAGWAIFRYSVRLPLGPFFTAMSLLLALMAVAFAGQGIKALQEAGVVGMQSLPFVTVPLLGIYPSIQTLGAQLLVLALLALGYLSMNRSQRKELQQQS